MNMRKKAAVFTTGWSFMLEMHEFLFFYVIIIYKGGMFMRVECNISAEHKEPYAVLYINKMTETTAKIISMLEKENTDHPALNAVREKKHILSNRRTYR